MGIQVIDRAVFLVGLVARDGAVSITALSKEADLPVSTVARILASLASHGVVEQTIGRKYRLGARLLTLAARVEPARNLVEIARAAMRDLSRATGEDVGLAVLQGREAVIVDWVYGPHPLKIIEPFSRSITLNCAFRKVLLAFQGDRWVKNYLAATRFPQFTPYTVTDKDKIWRQVVEIRKARVAISREENIMDAGSVAAPVFAENGQLLATIFVTAPLSRFTNRHVVKLKGAVLEASRRIMREMKGGALDPSQMLRNRPLLRGYGAVPDSDFEPEH